LAASRLVIDWIMAIWIHVSVVSGKASKSLLNRRERLSQPKVALEDEVAAVLYLPDGVEARKVDLFTLGSGELWSQDQCPVVELLLNDLWATV